MVVVGVYLSPSLSRAELEDRLGQIKECVTRYVPAPTTEAGDFNAWSTLWSSRRTNRRGAALEDWAASLRLCCFNTGATSTCVRPQGGESIVDVTWATPEAVARVRGWRVLMEAHTQSDHRYIGGPDGNSSPGTRTPPRRWTLSKFAEDPFEQMLLAGLWPAEDFGGHRDMCGAFAGSINKVVRCRHVQI